MMFTRASILFGMLIFAAFVSGSPDATTIANPLANPVPDPDRVITAFAPKVGRSPVPTSLALDQPVGQVLAREISRLHMISLPYNDPYFNQNNLAYDRFLLTDAIPHTHFRSRPKREISTASTIYAELIAHWRGSPLSETGEEIDSSSFIPTELGATQGTSADVMQAV
ncbi:hypothetical protein K438DRAFT_1774193 [Mycena galopus ATCC 62051]|nr:hypothetical protein K438DRAFT_1774193 [Mycena galopus ATCC 62051]